MRRAAELDRRYADLNLGFVDTSVMAIAERREMPILTFDFTRLPRHRIGHRPLAPGDRRAGLPARNRGRPRAGSSAPQRARRLTRKWKTAGERSMLPARSRARTRTVCLPAPKRREMRRPQNRGRPRSTLQTKTTPVSLDLKRKRAHPPAMGANQLPRVPGDARARGLGVDREGDHATAGGAPGEVDATDGDAVTAVGERRRNRERRGTGLRGVAVDLAAEGDRAVGAELDRRAPVAAQRRRPLRDRDPRRQRQGGDSAVGVDEAGPDRRRPEGADRSRGRGQRRPNLGGACPWIGLADERRDRRRVRRRGRGAAEAPDAGFEGGEEGRRAAIGGDEIGLGDDLLAGRRRGRER